MCKLEKGTLTTVQYLKAQLILGWFSRNKEQIVANSMVRGWPIETKYIVLYA